MKMDIKGWKLNPHIWGVPIDCDVLQIRDILMKSEKLKTSAKNNTVKDFEFSYFDETGAWYLYRRDIQEPEKRIGGINHV